jgi:light-regulated signal transduction histidine kinase (bacteriophytochrome)
MNDTRQCPSPGKSQAPAEGSLPSRLVPARTAFVYFLLGLCWIFFTDRLLEWLDLPTYRIAHLQTAKGFLFVIGSSLLLYFMLRRYQLRDNEAKQGLLASQAEVQRLNAELEARVANRTQQLEAANRELESFAYAVSHDLRAPLRSLSGFSQILRESSPPGLDEQSKHYLQRIHESSQRMSALIDDLLGLSRITRAEFNPRPVDLSQIVHDAAAVVRERYPGRNVEIEIAPAMNAQGDTRLLRIALENLLDNAWKYTAHENPARISVGVQQTGQELVYFVRDNGVGFDMQYAGKLFAPFQRLHAESEFPGTGIGLVTVQRIVARHGGRVWVEAKPNEGATFYFTLAEPSA